MTGSATLSHSTAVLSEHQTCALGGKTYAERSTVYVASFSSPRGRAFEAHTLLSGTIKVAPTGRGSFTIVTLKRK